jgi:hypothetical protein
MTEMAGDSHDRQGGLTLDACRWHVDAEAPPYKTRALEHFRDRYSVLLDFLRAEGLLANPALGQSVPNWMDFEFHDGDLTPLGRTLVRLCIGTWNPAFGHGHTQRHLVQWKRRLKDLRSREAQTGQSNVGHAAEQPDAADEARASSAGRRGPRS